jgi:hypothetical protein
MRDGNEGMNENYEKTEREQERMRSNMNRSSGYEKKDKPNYKAEAGGGKGVKYWHLKFYTAIVVWLGISFMGLYFPFRMMWIFGGLGFFFMFLIMYADWWYPRFRRWRRGY